MQGDILNVLIGGEAGQGLVTLGTLFTQTMVRSGYEVLVTQDYMSRVRGGHNTFAVRFGVTPPLAPVREIDFLVALDQESVDLHGKDLAPQGLVITGEKIDPRDFRAYQIPFSRLAPKPIFANIVALGVLTSAICADRTVLEGLLEEMFQRKGKEIVDQNREVLQNAWEWQRGHTLKTTCPPPPERKEGRMTMNGNEAIAMGALAAGCNFLSFYPMTPSTSVALTLLGKGKDLGLVAEQAEDEIAAANMALGASFAGGRALVPTSGGGFALMSEAVSLAGMIETPVVFVVAQRPGPATGLPTRTEQGDLELVLYAGHGEFPRAILAPGSVEECFSLTHKAFELTERYQTPVFLLTDQFLADSFRAVDIFDLDTLPEIPGPVFDDPDEEGYERFALTKSGISPRRIPGMGRALVLADSDEHTPDGHITEDHQVRIRMMEKRNRKMQGLAEEVIPFEWTGEDAPELLLVCWGSTRGAALEAMRLLNENGTKAAVMHFSQVWPIDGEKVLEALGRAKRRVCVEGNYTGQFAKLLRQTTGFAFEAQVHRFDGLPFTAAFIVEGLQE